MKTPAQLLIFASGRGSNFEAIVKACENKSLNAEICGLVTDKPGCGAVAIAKQAGIACFEIPLVKDSEKLTRSEHERLVVEAISKLKFDLIVLAGYMRVLTPKFIARYPKIVNIHPSLLPQFPGVDAYEQALRAGAKKTGATVHWVNEGIDTGLIIAQKSFEIYEGENLDAVVARGLKIEHELYVNALKKVLS